GVLGRLDMAVPDGTDIVLLAIGYTDLHNGASAAAVQTDIDTIVARIRAKKVEVVQLILVGSGVQKLADRTVVRADLRELSPDMMARGHPTEAGNAKLVELTLPAIEQAIRELPLSRKR